MVTSWIILGLLFVLGVLLIIRQRALPGTLILSGVVATAFLLSIYWLSGWLRGY